MDYVFSDLDDVYITSVFRRICDEFGFTIVVEAADRHGTLVWEAGKQHGLTHYLTFGLTPVQPETRSGSELGYVYDAEIWIGADDGVRYKSEVVHRWQPLTRDLFDTDGGHSLYHCLKRAARDSRGIEAADLTDTYVVPRSAR